MAVPWSEIAAHRERLIRVARRRVPTREDAEDVVHEAMVRCATFADLDEKRLGQFLTAVTVRLCADVYRGAERNLRAVRALETGDEPSPEELACAAAEAEELRALLDALPDRQRAVLVDRAFGLSVTQISDRHALTYKATESTLSRARATMRVALASAMALVTAVFGTLRRKPSIALALPITALAVATTVHQGAVPHAAAPPEVSMGTQDGRDAAYETGWDRPVSQATGATSSAVAARPVASRARALAPTRSEGREKRTIVEVDQGPVKGRVTNDEKNTTDIVVRCVQAESYHVKVVIAPDDPNRQLVFEPECRSHPGNNEGAPQ